MAVQEQEEYYQVSITEDPDNPPVLNVQISWQENTRSVTEIRRYPSPQELLSGVGRERFLRDFQSYAGVALSSAGLGEMFVPYLLSKKLGELEPFIWTGAVILGLGTFAAGLFIVRDGSVQSGKVSAIQQQISRVLRLVYTVNPSTVTPPQP